VRNKSDLSQVEAGRRNGCLDDEHRVRRQVGFEFGVVDVLRFLYLAAVLAPAVATVVVVARRAYDDPISVGRHSDALRVAAGHIEAQLVAPARVRVVHEQRPHLLGVEDVRAAAATGHQRVVKHLVAAPHLVDRVQLQELFPVQHPTNQHVPPISTYM